MILGREFYEIGISCLKPRHLLNKYDKEYYTVNCRKCPACLEKRRHSIISRLETLRSNSAKTYFVTLTYDDHFLPLAHFSSNCESCDVVSYSALHRKKLTKHYELSSCLLKAPDRLLLRHGGFSTTGSRYGANNFGVLLKSDLQKFFKRYRKQFNAVLPQDYRFRYFAIGEYGVKSFRPHFHSLLYFNRSVDTGRVLELVSNNWKFGRVDVQLVEASAASYCASYLNSTSPLPAFLRVGEFKPFQVCSNGSFFEMWPEQVEEFVDKELFNVPLFRTVPAKSGYVLRPLSRSTRLQFFPVLPGFHQSSVDSLRRRYSAFKRAAEEQGTLDPVFKMSTVCNHYIEDDLVPYSMLYALSVPEDSKRKRTFECIGHKEFYELYISRRVYLNCLDYGLDFDKYVDAIITYYKGSAVESEDVESDYEDNYTYKARHYSTAPTEQLPSSSFALSLLRYQYSVMEKNVSDLDDLKLYYDTYNNRSNTELYRIGDVHFNIITDDDCFSFYDLLQADVTDNMEFIKSLSCLQSDFCVKHKERNTYHALECGKCFI